MLVTPRFLHVSVSTQHRMIFTLGFVHFPVSINTPLKKLNGILVFSMQIAIFSQ